LIRDSLISAQDYASSLKSEIDPLVPLSDIDMNPIERNILSAKDASSYVRNVMVSDSSMAKISQELSEIENISLFSEKIDGFTSSVDFINNASSLIRQYLELLMAEKNAKESVSLSDENIKRETDNMLLVIKEFSSVLKETGTCPLCFSEVSGTSMDRIVGKYMGENSNV